MHSYIILIFYLLPAGTSGAIEIDCNAPSPVVIINGLDKNSGNTIVGGGRKISISKNHNPFTLKCIFWRPVKWNYLGVELINGVSLDHNLTQRRHCYSAATVIFPASVNTSGIYTCASVDPNGTTIIEVCTEMEIKMLGEQVTTVRTTERRVLFNCLATSFIAPNITWEYANNMNFGDIHERSISINSTTTLSTVQFEISENYTWISPINFTCRAFQCVPTAQDTTKTFTLFYGSTPIVSTKLALILLTLIILSTSIIFLCVYQRRVRSTIASLSKKGISEYSVKSEVRQPVSQLGYNMSERRDLLAYHIEANIDMENLKMSEIMLDVGKFAVTYSGTLRVHSDENELQVAIKTVTAKAKHSSIKALITEMDILKYLGKHDNIAVLLGACVYGKNLFLVFEAYERGTLFSGLQNMSFIIGAKNNSRTKRDTLHRLQQWALEVCRGMEQLASIKVVHCNLCTKNVVLDSRLTAKIFNFDHLHRVFPNGEYSMPQTPDEPLAGAWQSLESICYLSFSEKSDVWSYGVTLWEMFSLAAVPYEGIPLDPKFSKKLRNGLRLAPPPYASPTLYEVMQNCWNELPEDRPTFLDLKCMLETELKLLSLSENGKMEAEEIVSTAACSPGIATIQGPDVVSEQFPTSVFATGTGRALAGIVECVDSILADIKLWMLEQQNKESGRNLTGLDDNFLDKLEKRCFEVAVELLWLQTPEAYLELEKLLGKLLVVIQQPNRTICGGVTMTSEIRYLLPSRLVVLEKCIARSKLLNAHGIPFEIKNRGQDFIENSRVLTSIEKGRNPEQLCARFEPKISSVEWNQSPLSDERYYLHYTFQVTVKAAPEKIFMAEAYSFPIIPMLHSESFVCGCVIWNNAANNFEYPGSQIRIESLKFGDIVNAINAFLPQTIRPLGLNEYETIYGITNPLHNKVVTGRLVSENGRIEISWHDFIRKVHMKNFPTLEGQAGKYSPKYSFWVWFYTLQKFLQGDATNLSGAWKQGLILGYLTGDEVVELLRKTPTGTFLLRLSTSIPDAVVIDLHVTPNAGSTRAAGIYSWRIRSNALTVFNLGQHIMSHPEIYIHVPSNRKKYLLFGRYSEAIRAWTKLWDAFTSFTPIVP